MMIELAVQTERQVQFKEITAEIERIVRHADIRSGLVTLFVPHTTAAVTINENADPDVAVDMIHGLDKLAPLRDSAYRHLEGNSAAHIKSSLIGCSEQIIIAEGRLLLGTWQGIYFCEFDGPRSRKLIVKLSAD